jgi:hypothetical protein
MHVLKSAQSAVKRLRGRISLAFEKFRKNELEYERRRSGGMEGEGSYEGTRRYDSGVEKFVSKGHAQELAEKANRALNGQEGKALRDAEAAARRGPSIPRPVPRKPASNGRH